VTQRTGRQPRLVLFIRDLNIGGAQRQLIELASGMHGGPWRVTVLTLYRGGPLEPDLVARGVPYHSLDKRGRWDILGFWWRLVTEIRRERPDVLMSYLGAENLFNASLRPLFPRMRIVWGLRSSGVDHRSYERISWVMFQMARVASRLTHLIISNSHASVEDHARDGYPRDRMVVVPNGIDAVRFAPDPVARREVRDEWGVDGSTTLVGLVGRLDPKKDHPTFLRAASRLAGERADVRFVCVGPGPDGYRDELLELTRSLGLGDRVIWAGPRLDMPRVYAALDLLVSSSAWGEGFPNVVAEAMASGVPCVVAAAGDSAVVVGDTGWVCRPGDVEDLARAMREAVGSRESLEERGRLARQRIVDEFSPARLVERTIAQLDRLVGR
jgi:glycosyltransferase involved in cell wall biosynthesis